MLNYQTYLTRKKVVDMNHAALLVIDMQNYFSDLTPKIINNVNRIIEKFRSIDRPIIFTQYGDDSANTMLSELWPETEIDVNSKRFEFVPELKQTEDDLIIFKPSYDAFYQTDLDAYLKKHNITDVVIIGVITNCCCETTARSALVRNYRVHVVPDANTTYDETLHQASLSNLAYAFAYLPLTAELIK